MFERALPNGAIRDNMTHKGECEMSFERVIVVVAVFCAVVAGAAPAQTKATEEVTELLREFISNAGNGERAMFDKFFADDVIYTRATGEVITKASIMEGLGKPVAASDGKSSYSAEDITVHEYGDTAIVAFRLEGRTERPGGKVELAHYRNTGTFLRRGGRWQVVAWQATKISEAAK
jgi:ketosteroid isomerase-like protein